MIFIIRLRAKSTLHKVVFTDNVKIVEAFLLVFFAVSCLITTEKEERERME